MTQSRQTRVTAVWTLSPAVLADLIPVDSPPTGVRSWFYSLSTCILPCDQIILSCSGGAVFSTELHSWWQWNKLLPFSGRGSLSLAMESCLCAQTVLTSPVAACSLRCDAPGTFGEAPPYLSDLFFSGNILNPASTAAGDVFVVSGSFNENDVGRLFAERQTASSRMLLGAFFAAKGPFCGAVPHICTTTLCK